MKKMLKENLGALSAQKSQTRAYRIFKKKLDLFLSLI